MSIQKRTIRVSRLRLAIGLLLSAAVVLWGAYRDMHTPVVRPAGRVAVPAGGRWADPGRISHAHEGWLAVRAFEDWLDSLRRDPAGRKVYDSLLRMRPGLPDSARRAGQFFLSQENKTK